MSSNETECASYVLLHLTHHWKLPALQKNVYTTQTTNVKQTMCLSTQWAAAQPAPHLQKDS